MMSALIHHNYISVSVSPRLDQHLALSIQQPLHYTLLPPLNPQLVPTQPSSVTYVTFPCLQQ